MRKSTVLLALGLCMIVGGTLLPVGLVAAAGGLVWQLVFNKPGPVAAPKSSHGAAKSAKAGPRDLWMSPTTSGRGEEGVVVGGSF